MNAIAAEAGISKPIFYRHFGGKGALYRAIAQRHTDAVLDKCRTALDSVWDRRDCVEATLDAYLTAIEAHPQMYRFLMHPEEAEGDADSLAVDHSHVAPLLHLLGEELAVVISERLELGRDGELVGRVWGHGIVGMMHAAGDWWLVQRPCERADLVRHLADLLWGQLKLIEDKARGV
jgi:AcrR family transcriptional regulator